MASNGFGEVIESATLLDLAGLRGGEMLALRWQDRDKVIYSLRLHQRAMAPIVACLTARLTFALLPFLSLPLVERSEEHTSELQSRENLVCRLLLEKKKKKKQKI